MRLSDSDKKELAIWGGVAFVTILVVNYFLIGGEVDQLQRDIRQGEALAAEYETLYPESQAGRLPAADAKRVAAEVLQQQQAELQTVRQQLIYPGSKELVPQELVQYDFRQGIDYNSSLNVVQAVNRRLSGRGISRSVRMPEVLPFEGAGDINAEEDGGAQRSQQIAQLAAYGTLYEHLLSAKPDSIGAVNLSGEMYCDPSRQIVAVPVATSVTGGFDELRVIEKLLSESTAGLHVRRWSMSEQGNRYVAEIGVVLLVPMNPQWQVNAVRVPTTQGRDPRSAPR